MERIEEPTPNRPGMIEVSVEVAATCGLAVWVSREWWGSLTWPQQATHLNDLVECVATEAANNPMKVGVSGAYDATLSITVPEQPVRPEMVQTYDPDPPDPIPRPANPWTVQQVLNAVKARVDGVWDDPDLVRYGPIGDLAEDIAAILRKA